ncbi:Prolyl 4-hydroxylase, alpha polypeptide, partial [Homalodisca vitripennis]
YEVDEGDLDRLELCRVVTGSNLQPQHVLSCRYVHYNKTRLRLGPFRVEELQLDPPVLLFHNIINDAEIREVQRCAHSRKRRGMSDWRYERNGLKSLSYSGDYDTNEKRRGMSDWRYERNGLKSLSYSGDYDTNEKRRGMSDWRYERNGLKSLSYSGDYDTNEKRRGMSDWRYERNGLKSLSYSGDYDTNEKRRGMSDWRYERNGLKSLSYSGMSDWRYERNGLKSLSYSGDYDTNEKRRGMSDWRYERNGLKSLSYSGDYDTNEKRRGMNDWRYERNGLKSLSYSGSGLYVTYDRSSEMATIPPGASSVIDRLDQRMGDMSNLVTSTSERTQVTRFGVGGECLFHHDFRRSGYLNDVARGGHTVFEHWGLSFRPQKGAALFWFNVLRNGMPDHSTEHGDCPVLTGSKWSWLITN